MEVKFDYSKLKGKIIECCGTREKFAEKLGVSSGSITNKLNHVYGWQQDEIIKACTILNIAPQEIPTYFFAV